MKPLMIKGVYDGLPYEGPPLNLKNDDPPHMRPRLVATTQTRVFRMDNQKDLEDYEQLMHGVTKGYVQISYEDKQWVPRLETWKILIRTLHLKYIEPEDTTRAQDS